MKSKHMTPERIIKNRKMNDVLARLYAINNGWDGITTEDKNKEAAKEGLLRNSINNAIRRAKETGWMPKVEGQQTARIPACIAWMERGRNL